MQAAKQNQKKAVSSHVAENESVKAGRTGPGTAFVVTNSRVLSMKDSEKDGRPMRNIRSTSLTAGVRGVEIEELGAKAVHWIQASIGCLVLLTGVFAIQFAFGTSGVGSVGAMLVGLFTLVGGGYLVYDSLDTPDGEIRVSIKTDAGTDTYWLPEDESDVAAAVSEVVGKNTA